MRVMNKGVLKRFLAILFVFVFFSSSALAASAAYVNCSALVVRSSASASSKKLGTLSQGAKVKVISSSNGWARISYNGKTGYVSTKYLSKSSGSKSSSSSGTTAVTRTKAYVKNSAYIYQSASTSSTKLCVASKGATVYVTGKNGSFRKVTTTSGVTGYIKAGNLDKSSGSGSSSSGKSGGSKASKVISMAKSQLGKPYVSGDCGPSAYDCSGLTWYVYSQYGVYLNRTAQSQGYSNGSTVSKSNLRAGDLVFFDTEEDGDQCDHVGIYLGSGMFLHASSAAGRVIISNMSYGFYAQAFSWGRRII